MKVAVLTMFNGLDSTYSLVNVVETHIQMLLDHGVSVTLLVSETCPDSGRYGVFNDERLEWRKVKNTIDGRQIQWYDYAAPMGTLHESFEAETEAISQDLVKHLQDVDVCMMHDILYQGWHYVHNIAVRKAQKLLPHVRFIAFTHSIPVKRPAVIDKQFYGRYSPMENTLFAYPTLSGIPALAKQYGVPEGFCRAVYNTVPVMDYLAEEVQRLHRQVDLLSPEVLIVYPARLTRAKQLEKVAALAGCIACFCEKTVKVVFCDFVSMDTDSEKYMEEIIAAGISYGLAADNIVFTSRFGYTNGFPRKAVLDLFALSNLFVCPSFSESFGLTVLEAASRGNFIVLNEAVPALEELGKTLHAYFMRWDARNFGYDTHESYQPSELSYYKDHAVNIINRMREDPAIHSKTIVRTQFNMDWIWQNQMAPLLLTKLDNA